MKTLTFEIKIDAPAAKVWQALWNDKNYREWTAVFMKGSHAVSDWEEGSSIKFLGPSGEGMYSKIERKIVNKQMTFRHLGSVQDGKEIPNSEWTDSIEEYVLEEKNGKTTLKASVQTLENYAEMFNEAFPEALKIVKKISEKP
ncbi:SRPBCC domain-containing protein [Aequorivita sp. SDUM287046]|uniref:SRPBCC domain-containing protein n=1 Tax=Aequorivita aurantiaca TaxID=3053356 RepID=A0ABT8DHI7_9FLAO|nr:SRPBCC domain-containing protein [Aequorivita aurantiaca]MDN3724239.1 SRPBCC domain-containing protein [Aequorivita aurantiaca]